MAEYRQWPVVGRLACLASLSIKAMPSRTGTLAFPLHRSGRTWTQAGVKNDYRFHALAGEKILDYLSLTVDSNQHHMILAQYSLTLVISNRFCTHRGQD